MASGQLAQNLLIILVTFIAAFFFVAAEFALVQTRPSQLEDAIKKGQGNVKKLKRGLHMVQNLNEYLSTTQVGTSVTGILLGWIGEGTLEAILITFFGWTHLTNGHTTQILGAIVGVLVLTYLEVVLTEIVPKNISIDMPLKMLMRLVTPLHIFHTIAYPFVWLLNTSAIGIVKLMGMAPADEENQVFSQSEILRLSQSAVLSGQMDQNDVLYMRRAFELNDKVAKDIMVDRTSLTVIDVTSTVKEALRAYLEEGYSRFPVVADNDKDKILGYIYIYDIIRQDQVDGDLPLSRILRSIISVPESMPIHDILIQMIQKQTPIVVVVDEYGGTSGIVTDKDIYEELFGTVKDEIDDVSDEYIIKQADGTYRVSGKTTLYDFERYFRTDVPEFKSSDVITVAGYIIDHHPNLELNQQITIDHFTFTVADIEHGFVNWFTVTPGKKPDAESEAATEHPEAAPEDKKDNQ